MNTLAPTDQSAPINPPLPTSKHTDRVVPPVLSRLSTEEKLVGPALNRLPVDVLSIICTFLTPLQKLSVSMSCKALYSDFGNADNDRLWIISLPTNWMSNMILQTYFLDINSQVYDWGRLWTI